MPARCAPSFGCSEEAAKEEGVNLILSRLGTIRAAMDGASESADEPWSDSDDD